MSVITGTVTGVSLLTGNPEGAGARRSYLLTCNFGAYVSADSGALAGVVATMQNAGRGGKTFTIASGNQGIGVTCVGPGVDTAGQAVYVGAVTVSSASVGTLAFNLTDSAGTELVSATACTGVQLAVVVDLT